MISQDQITVSPVINQIIVEPQISEITVASPGPQGPPGPTQEIFYVHTQNTPNSVWTINHNLNGNPTAVVLDSSGTQYEGTFSYPTLNQMIITFSAGFSGTAYVV